MNLLVTGGLGFIGSHLAAELLRDADAHVTLLDNLSSAALDPDELGAELAHGAAGTLDCVVADVADYAAPAGRRLDAVFHLASVVGPAAVLRQAGRITESIAHDAAQVMRLAAEHGARLVFVSTSEVYGGGRDGYCQEETPRVFRGRPSARQEYAAAKMACEISIANRCRAGKLDAVVIRPFNVAGVRQQGRGGFVLPRFVGQALHGLPLTVFGSGRQLRAFTDVRDVAAGIAVACRQGAAGEVYNIGNPANRVSINQLADCVLQATGSTAGKVHVDPRSIYGPAYADAADKFPDAERLTRLGWRPARTLQETVDSVLQWMRKLPLRRVAEIAGLQPCGKPAGAEIDHQEIVQY